MNVKRLFQKFGLKGDLARTVYDLQTGLPGAGSASVSGVSMGLLGKSQIEHGNADSSPLREFVVLIHKDELASAGFPVPPKDGDLVTVGGTKGTIRVAVEKIWAKEVVYECRFEGVNG